LSEKAKAGSSAEAAAANTVVLACLSSVTHDTISRLNRHIQLAIVAALQEQTV